MLMLAHVPTGPWPDLSTCPCCGQPWPHVPVGPIPFEPLKPFEAPEIRRPEPTPSPFVIEVEPEAPTLAVSGVGLDFLLFLRGSWEP